MVSYGLTENKLLEALARVYKLVEWVGGSVAVFIHLLTSPSSAHR